MFNSNRPSFHYIGKSVLCASAICIMLFGVSLTESQAASGTINGSVVNVRSAPSSSANITGTLLKDVQVELLELSGDWYQIKFANLQGFVARELITTINSSSAPSVIFNGTKMQFEVDPLIENGRTLVPLRAIFEAMGATVEWDEITRTVTARNSDTTVILPLGSTSPTVNGQVSKLEVPAKIVDDRTLAPLRFVGEAFGGEVDWNEQFRTITIAYTPTPAPVIIPEETTPVEETPNAEETAQAEAEEEAINLQLLKDLAVYRTNLKLIDGSVMNSAALLNQQPNDFNTDQLAVFKTYLKELSKYQANIRLPDGEVVNSADITIMGDSYLTADQLEKWIEDETPRLIAKANATGLEFKPIPDLAELYIKIGADYGIRGDIAFCQAAKETGYWQFTGSVQSDQNNYCGLYALGRALTVEDSLYGAAPEQVCLEAGRQGATFLTPAAGVEAHIQHLYAYATKDDLPSGKVRIDPRFVLVIRGVAPDWLQLNARWAVPGTTYGQSILADYWLNASK